MAPRLKQLDNPKRVLIIANRQSPLIQERGMVGSKGGYEIFWYSFQREEMKGLRSFLISAPNHFGRVSIFCSPFLLRSFIQRIQPGLIHVHYAYQGLDTLLLARFRPLMVTVMGGDILPDQGFYGYRKWMVKRMLDASDIITSKSRFLDAALNRIGNYGDKIRRVTWGVDTKTFRPGLEVNHLRQKWGIDPEDLVFFCPRICQPFYNKHVTIESFAGYLRKSGSNPKAKLLVAELFAEDAYRRRLRVLVEELKLSEYVRFVGEVPHSEMAAYYNLADIMVATPGSDGLPQSLYEAMACGTYPILGNLSQYQEWIEDGTNGRMVEVGSVSALSEAMGWAAGHPEHRMAAALLNRQKIIQVAEKEIQDRLVNSIYEELLKQYAGGG
jgi:glycosyltransferase involved in cell wall biosynthesis